MIAVGCRHCGFNVPPDAAVCGGCGRPAIDDWRRHRRTIDLDAAPRRLTASADAFGFRSSVPRAWAARACLSASIGIVIADLLVWGTRWIAEPDRVLEAGGRTVEIDDLARLSTLTLLGSIVLTATALAAWARRAAANRKVLGLREVRYIRQSTAATIAIAPAIAVVAWSFTPGVLDRVDDRLLVSVLRVGASACIGLIAHQAHGIVGRATAYQHRVASDSTIDIRQPVDSDRVEPDPRLPH